MEINAAVESMLLVVKSHGKLPRYRWGPEPASWLSACGGLKIPRRDKANPCTLVNHGPGAGPSHGGHDKYHDTFVDAFAMRIASFDKQAIAETKRLVHLNSLPPDAEIAPEWDAFLASVQRPAAQARIKKLMERGFHKPGDVENGLGHYVAQLGT